MPRYHPGLPLHLGDFCNMISKARAQPVMLITRTLPRMLLRGNPYKKRGVVCYTGWNGFIGAQYASVVNRQRDREGGPVDADGDVENFYSDSLWSGRGRCVKGNKHLRVHVPTGRKYLAFYPRTNAEGEIQYLWRRYCHADEGEQMIATPCIDRWLRKSEPSKRPGTRKKIPWRTFNLDGLVSIRIARNTYRIIHPQTIEREAALRDA